MKNYKILLLVFLIIPFITFSQEGKDSVVVKDKPERPAFESSFIIDNPTNVLFDKNTLEVQMGHRFGVINGDKNDMAGFWGDSNIRIGLSYAIHDRLTIGYGTTRKNRLQDFNWKLSLLRQTRANKMPISLSYYGNFVVDARKPENRFYYIQQR